MFKHLCLPLTCSTLWLPDCEDGMIFLKRFYGLTISNIYIQDEEVDAADPDKRGNMKLMDQGREADNEFEEGKSVSLISRSHSVP